MRISVERRQNLAAGLSLRIDRRCYREDTEKEKECGDDHHQYKIEARLVIVIIMVVVVIVVTVVGRSKWEKEDGDDDK